MSSLLSTSTAVSSGRVAVFIFHVTFPIPVTISPTPPLFLMYSIYRLNGPGNKIQPCVTPFAVVKVHLASYSVCRSRINTVKCLVIPTLLMLFYIFECCRLSKFCVICQTVWHFCGASLCCPWFTYISYLLHCPKPFSFSCSFHWRFLSYICRKLLNNSQEDLSYLHEEIVKGALVCAFCDNSFLSDGMKIDVRCFPSLWLRRNF